jgi:hypothetical protein
LEGSPVVDWLKAGMDVRHSTGEVTSFPAFKLEALPDGQRIITDAKAETFTRNFDGSLGILSEGSTQAITHLTRHAGICRTRRFSFEMP